MWLRKKQPFLLNKLTGILNNSFWREHIYNQERNLKSHKRWSKIVEKHCTKNNWKKSVCKESKTNTCRKLKGVWLDFFASAIVTNHMHVVGHVIFQMAKLNDVVIHQRNLSKNLNLCGVVNWSVNKFAR